MGFQTQIFDDLDDDIFLETIGISLPIKALCAGINLI
jgi:hypothetical protein